MRHGELEGPGVLNSFVNRGDPAATDFAVGDFTTDGTWRTLDIAATGIPASAKAVLLQLEIGDDAAASLFMVRTGGQSNAINIALTYTQVSGVLKGNSIVIPMNGSNTNIEYWASNLTWTTINLDIGGWWV